MAGSVDTLDFMAATSHAAKLKEEEESAVPPIALQRGRLPVHGCPNHQGGFPATPGEVAAVLSNRSLRYLLLCEHISKVRRLAMHADVPGLPSGLPPAGEMPGGL